MTAILLFGFLLLGLSLYDLIITVIAPKGAGPLTDRICRLVSRLGKTISISTGWLCLLIVVTAWVLLLWMGWSVIFLSDPNSLVNSQTGVPTDVAEKAYFVGYCLSTLGLGDYTPTSDIWRLTTNFVSFSGLGTITLAITYIIPVLSAATEKRQLADLLHDLFSTPLAEVDRDRLLRASPSLSHSPQFLGKNQRQIARYGVTEDAQLSSHSASCFHTAYFFSAGPFLDHYRTRLRGHSRAHRRNSGRHPRG